MSERQGLDREYWEGRYQRNETGWDIGHISTPLKEYFDQLTDRSLRILIPGAGNAYEAAYLHEQGFTHVHVIDLAPSPLQQLQDTCPSFPEEHLILGDFFAHAGKYDRVIEQTFFCALYPSQRSQYVQHMHQLLMLGGRLVGLLFDDPLYMDRPPFGGSKQEYEQLFFPPFKKVIMEQAYNSIAPRAGRELFFVAERI